jgi:hypothetical protein
MTYSEKVAYAHRVIENTMIESKRPAIMSSFGKDSMVMLDLVRKHINPDVIFHREPFQPKKYRFANSVIEELNLTVFDYPPIQMSMQEKEGEVEIVGHYPMGAKSVLLPTGIRTPMGEEEFACGLEDIYLKPLGTFNYPWDMIFVGHKSSDIDPIYGAIPINSDIVRTAGCASASYPIRFFTDEDVWKYTEDNHIPIHHSRYEKLDSEWKEREDKSDNPDYMAACTACMTKEGQHSVPCPKRNGLMVNRVAEQLVWADKINPVHMRT